MTGDVDNGRGCTCVKVGDICEVPIPLSQFVNLVHKFSLFNLFILLLKNKVLVKQQNQSFSHIFKKDGKVGMFTR